MNVIEKLNEMKFNLSVYVIRGSLFLVVGGKASVIVENALVGDKAERFTTREEEKFKFLGK